MVWERKAIQVHDGKPARSVHDVRTCPHADPLDDLGMVEIVSQVSDSQLALSVHDAVKRTAVTQKCVRVEMRKKASSGDVSAIAALAEMMSQLDEFVGSMGEDHRKAN